MTAAYKSEYKIIKTPGFGKRIRVFSFILTIFVIWIHTPEMTSLPFEELMQGNNLLFSSIQSIIKKIGSAAVPGFFMLSGYLFFRDLKENRLIVRADKGECCGIRSEERRIALGIISSKIMKRVRTILIPYVIWNLIYFGLNIIAKSEPVNLTNIFEAIVYYKYNPVFWYMHQLIRITVLAPILYFLIKKKAAAIPVLIGLFVMAVEYEIFPFHFANEDAIFYYAFGAVTALHYDFIETAQGKIGKSVNQDSSDNNHRRMPMILICAALAFITFKISLSGTELASEYFNSKYLNSLHLLIATNIIFRLSAAALLMNLLMLFDFSKSEDKKNIKEKKYNRLGILDISFFIYAVHPIEIKLIKILQDMMGYGTDGTVMFVLFLLMPLLCYILTYLTALFMHKYMRKIYLILTGGR